MGWIRAVEPPDDPENPGRDGTKRHIFAPELTIWRMTKTRRSGRRSSPRGSAQDGRIDTHAARPYQWGLVSCLAVRIGCRNESAITSAPGE
jgi:hypothetical protein